MIKIKLINQLELTTTVVKFDLRAGLTYAIFTDMTGRAWNIETHYLNSIEHGKDTSTSNSG